jgi:hypothetical protein
VQVIKKINKSNKAIQDKTTDKLDRELDANRAPKV